MQSFSRDLPAIKATSTSFISTREQVSQLDSNAIKAVFDSAKVVGLANLQGLCEYKINQSQSEKTSAEKLAAASDITQILNSKGFRAAQLMVNDEVNLDVWDKKNHPVSMSWLCNLHQTNLKEINALLIALDKNKQTILDAFKPGKCRDEKIDVVGSWYDFSAPHIVAKEGCLYIYERVRSDDTVLLTRDELLVLFKENLNGLDLSRCTFNDMDLSGANLTGTNLKDSKIIDTDLTGAAQEKMIIDGATFCRVIGFELFSSTAFGFWATTFEATEIVCDAKQYFKNSLAPSNLSILLWSADRDSAIKTVLNKTILPQKIRLANAFGLEITCQKELVVLMDYVLRLDPTKRTKLIQKYSNFFKQLLEKCIAIELYRWSYVEAHYDKYGELLDSEFLKKLDKEAWRVHIAALDLYGEIKSPLGQKKTPSAELQKEGRAISLNTVELLDKQKDINQDIHNLLYANLYPIDQSSLSVTNKFNHQAYESFCRSNLNNKNEGLQKLISEQEFSAIELSQHYPQYKINQTPFSQAEWNFLADKVMGPVTIAKIEKGEMAIADAILIKQLFDEEMNGQNDVYLIIKRYGRDGFLSEQDIANISRPTKQLLALPIIQFLINSGQLTRDQLLSDRGSYLDIPVFQDWLKNGKLTVALFFKFTEEQLRELIRVPLKSLIDEDRLKVAEVLDCLTPGFSQSDLIGKLEMGYTARQAMLLLSVEKRKKLA